MSSSKKTTVMQAALRYVDIPKATAFEQVKTEKKFIGISENRTKHILGVARRCYELAKAEGKNEDFCRKMWFIGWNHDIGYEFSEKQSEHPEIGFELLKLVGVPKDSADVLAVREHGKYTENKTDEWRILNMADMTVDSKGNRVSAMERLADIKERYGEYSDQYLTAADICVSVGLIQKEGIERCANGG